MKENTTSQTQQKRPHPRIQQAYNRALLQFQAYLIEKKIVGEADLTKTHLLKMIVCN